MPLKYLKVSISVVWILAVCVIGVATGVASALGWAVLAGVALTPVLIIQRLWNPPLQTMSESIREARR